jgi:HEAT repeat protein
MILNERQSRQWDDFMDNFFNETHMKWHDGIDPTSVCRLEGAERDRAETMLIESMQQGSQWAPMGLRELRSLKAVPMMKEMLFRTNGDLLREIAIALNVIENTKVYNQYIIQVLRECPSAYCRLKAARRLRDFPTPEAIEALFDAVNDVDYLVRSQATESLLVIHGLEPQISEQKDIYPLISFHPVHQSEESKRKAVESYRKAEEMLRNLFENTTD